MQELGVEIADWHQIKRIRPTTHVRRAAMPELSIDKVCYKSTRGALVHKNLCMSSIHNMLYVDIALDSGCSMLFHTIANVAHPEGKYLLLSTGGCAEGVQSVKSQGPDFWSYIYFQVPRCSPDLPNQAMGGSIQVLVHML